MTQFTPSPQQEAFFSELQTGTSSIALIAVAGSGKTTTIVHACQFLDPFKLNVFLAFNKRIVEELRTRLPSHVQCATFHSRGNQALSRSLPSRPRINFNKVPDALKKNLKWKDFLLYGAFASKLVGFAKNAGVGTELEEDSLSTWRALVAHNNLFGSSLDFDEDEAIRISRAAFDDSNSSLSSIDGDDMLYLAVKLKCVFDLASHIFVDEAQDTNAVQRVLLRRMLAPSGRVIVVGDPDQAIYGFRGSDAAALQTLISEFDCVTLPLSTCFRCSQSVIAEVQKFLQTK